MYLHPKMETLAGLRYAQLMMVTAFRQGERGSTPDSGCKESSLCVCTCTCDCLPAGQTGLYSHPRQRLLFAAVFRLLFPAWHRGLCPLRYTCWYLTVTIYSYKKACSVLRTHMSLDMVLKQGVNFPSYI